MAAETMLQLSQVSGIGIGIGLLMQIESFNHTWGQANLDPH